MVNKEIIINKLIEFFNNKLTVLSSDSQLVNVFVRPFVARIIEGALKEVNEGDFEFYVYSKSRFDKW